MVLLLISLFWKTKPLLANNHINTSVKPPLPLEYKLANCCCKPQDRLFPAPTGYRFGQAAGELTSTGGTWITKSNQHRTSTTRQLLKHILQ